MRHVHCILLAIPLILLLTAANLTAAIIGPETAIPNEYVLINFNGTGLDWVYAGPTTPGFDGPDRIHLPSFRATEGWRFATADEWVVRPDWPDFIQPGLTTADVLPVDGFTDHSTYRFASEYWSAYTHVDLGDAELGSISNGLDIGLVPSAWETLYVRNTSIPEPSTYLILGGLILCLGLANWWKQRLAA